MFQQFQTTKGNKPVDIKLLFDVVYKYKQQKLGKCTHAITDSELVFKCLTCCTNPNAILCQNCFVESQHSGHNWYSENVDDDADAICDCGNFQVYRPECCCSRHRHQAVNIFGGVPKTISKRLLTEMFVVMKHALRGQLDDLVIDTIAKNPVLVRLACIAMLHNGDEERGVEYFVEHADEFINVSNPKGSIVNALVDTPSKNMFKLCEVLIADKVFMVGAMNIIGHRLGDVLCGKENRLVSMIVSQSILEDQVFVQNDLIVDQIGDAVLDYVTSILPDWRKDRDDEVKKVVARMENLNSRNLLAFWHKVLYSSSKFLPMMVRLQLMFAGTFCLDPNEDLGEDGSTQEMLYIGHVQMSRFFLQHRMWRGILRLDADPSKTLSRTILDENNDVLTQTTYAHLVEQIGHMLRAYYECKGLQEKPFTAMPSHFCQLMIVDVAEEFGLDLADFVGALRERFLPELELDTFVTDLIQPLVQQNLWFQVVDNKLELPKNRENFDRLVGFMNRVVINKIPQFESIHIVSRFTEKFPHLVGVIQQEMAQFDPVVRVDYLALLNNLPAPNYRADFLKKIIYCYDLDTLNYSALADISITRLFRFADMLKIISNNYQMVWKGHFASREPKLRNFDDFEPTIVLGQSEILIEEITELLGKPFLPKSVLDFGSKLICMFDRAQVEESCSLVLQQYQAQTFGVGKAMVAIRLLKSLDEQSNIGAMFTEKPRHEQIAQLLNQETVQEKKQIDVKLRLQQLKMRASQPTQLMKMEERPAELDQKKETLGDNTCQKCHQELGAEFVVPIKILTSLKDDNRVHQLCIHKFHKECTQKMDQCPVCKADATNSLRLGKGVENAAVIYCQMRAIVEAFKYVQQDELSKPKMIQEIQKLQFLIRSSKRAFAAKTPLEEQLIEMLDKTQTQPAAEVYHMMQCKVPRIHRSLVADNVFLAKSSEIIQQCSNSCCQKCGEALTVPKNPVQCLLCGNYMHMRCCFEKNEFKCFVCSATFCLHIRTLTIIHSKEQIHEAPYFNSFEQKLGFTVGDQQLLDKRLMNLLMLNLIVGVNEQFSEQYLKKMGFKEMEPQLEMLLRRLAMMQQ